MAILISDREKWCDIMENLIECPICCEIPTNNILQCVLGHHICISCRYKLKNCPTCKQNFSNIRNFVAEEFCTKYFEIMASLQIPTKKEVRKMLENKWNVSTQTEKILKASVWMQTENLLKYENKETQCDIYKTENQKEQISTNLKKKKVIGYQCCLNSCIISLPFGKMIQHLRCCHKDTFYEIKKNKEFFKRQFELSYIVPKKYDFAYSIKHMGLFFINIAILPSGDLKGEIFLVNNPNACKRFIFDMTIGSGEKSVTYSSLVKTCKVVNSKSLENCLYVKDLKMKEIAHLNYDALLFNCSFCIKRSKLAKENHNSVNHE